MCSDLTNATTAVDLTATLCLNVLASGSCFENHTKNPQSQVVSIGSLKFPGVVDVGALFNRSWVYACILALSTCSGPTRSYDDESQLGTDYVIVVVLAQPKETLVRM